MPGFDTQRIIAAWQAGRQIKDQNEKKVRDAEDRDWELKQRAAQLKLDNIQHQLLKRKLEQENAAAMQGQPGQEATAAVPLSATPGGERQDNAAPMGPDLLTALTGMQRPAAPTYTADIPQGVGRQNYDLPLPAQQISGVDMSALGLGSIPGYTAQPQSQQEGMRAHLAQLKQAAQIEQQKNTVTLPAELLGGKPTDPPVSVDKSLADNLISGVQQSQRQNDQQTFTASENEKRLKAESERAAADRASRESIAQANRLQTAANAIKAGKTSKVAQQSITMANQFDQNPIVKNYAVVQEGAQFANSTGNTSADDIGLLYAFAKVMDPNSVVREGEYATVQKYAQSWAEQFGFSAKRIFTNSQFLTDQAKANMRAVIAKKAAAAQSSYENFRTQASKKFENIGENPEEWLGNYNLPTAGAGGGANPYRQGAGK